MAGAQLGELEKPVALLVVEGSRQLDFAVDGIEFALLRLAVCAVGRVNSRVPQVDGDALERQLLPVGVEPHRHRRTGAEPSEEIIVGRRTGIRAADLYRFVRPKAVASNGDLLGKAGSPAANHHPSFGWARTLGHG